MALDFPSAPAIGAIYTSGGRSWIWDGIQWDSYGEATLDARNAFTNRQGVVNGALDIWQRGGGPFTGASGATADNFGVTLGGSTMSVTRQAFTPGNPIPGYEPASFLRCAVTSVAGAANRATVKFWVEGVRSYAGQQITVSWFSKTDANKNVALEVQQNFGAGGSTGVDGIASQLIANTTAWTRKAVTLNVPAITGKVIGTAGDFLSFRYWMDAGSDWNLRAANLGQQSGTFDFWGFQIDPGPVALPFRHEPIVDELPRCQRYYLPWANGNVDFQMAFTRHTTTAGYVNVKCPVSMRAFPTLIGNGGRIVTYNASFTLALQNVSGASILPSYPNLAEFHVEFTHAAIGGDYPHASFDTLGFTAGYQFSAEMG